MGIYNHLGWSALWHKSCGIDHGLIWFDMFYILGLLRVQPSSGEKSQRELLWCSWPLLSKSNGHLQKEERPCRSAFGWAFTSDKGGFICLHQSTLFLLFFVNPLYTFLVCPLFFFSTFSFSCFSLTSQLSSFTLLSPFMFVISSCPVLYFPNSKNY